MRALPRNLLPGIILLALAACSDDDPAAPDPGPVTQASRTIAPSGGTLRVESEAGVVMAVSFPAGAVLEPTPVSLRATDAPSGIRARFAIVPSGLELLVPATFTVTLPEGAIIDDTFGISFERTERVPVPTEVDPGARTLTASLNGIGFGDVAAGFGGSASATNTTEDGEEFINVEEFECQLVRDSLMDAILRAQAFVGAFPPDLASPLIQQYRAALLVCESTDVAEATVLIRQVACTHVTSASTHASLFQVETGAQLKETLGAMIAADALAQETGASCAVPSTDYEREMGEFVDHYTARINAPDFVASFPTWDALFAEIRRVLELSALADFMGSPTTRDRIDTEVMPALFARLREVAREKCIDGEDNSFIADLLTGGHLLGHPVAPMPGLPFFTGLPGEQLQREYQLCGTSLSVATLDADGNVVDEVTLDESNPTNVGFMRAPANGRVRLIGDEIQGLRCGTTISRLPVRVRAEKSGSFGVVQLGELTSTLTPTVTSIADGLDLDDGGTFQLIVERFGVPCASTDVGPSRMELFRITLNEADTGPRAGSGGWSGECPDEEGGTFSVGGSFEMTLAEDGAVSGTYDGAATGTISGVVQADGTFEASASGTAGGCTWSGTIDVSGPTITGSGTWTCPSCSGVWAFGD